MSDHDERSVRLKKLEGIKELGIHPYPEKYDKQHTLQQALGKNEGDKVKTAGRLMLIRDMGKIIFAHLKDQSAKMQLAFKEDVVGKDKMKFVLKYLDLGDFIGVEGDIFLTKTGEKTILVQDFTFLGKCLRSIPKEHFGLQDKELKYRQRYLDLILDDSTRQRFDMRSNFIKALRDFYEQNGFLEVETSILGNTASGALATPFTTHHHALDLDVYLRIAPEVPLKELVIGGYEKVFELGKIFRNEGIDPSHLQEFTEVEHYAAYWNYEDNMRFTEEMFTYLLQKLLGTLQVSLPNREGHMVEVDFTAPWKIASFRDLLLKDAGIDMDQVTSTEELRKAIKTKKIDVEDIDKLEYGNLIDALYKKVSRPHIVGPLFLTGHPIELSPLARKNDVNPKRVDRFQLVVNGWEVVNAYSELVDPLDQKERFEHQSSAKEKGDTEAHGKDDDYVKAMEYGMPPISGWGMGVDRLVALLTAQSNLRDVVLFPLLRPEEHTTISDHGNKNTEPANAVHHDSEAFGGDLKDEKSRRFVAVLNKKIELGKLLNALGHMTAGLSGGYGLGNEMNFLQYEDKDGGAHPFISHFPFIVLQADNGNQIRKIRQQAMTQNIPFTDFTSTMTVGTSKDQLEATKNAPEGDLEYYGLCLFGSTEELKKITGKLSLFK